MNTKRIITSAILLLLAAGCDKKDPPAPAASATAVAASSQKAKGQEHAQAGVKPGSHEDWCVEHGVAESQCTRCNASLKAAFKATGDWCVEHDLPESQCKLCNPDLKIERPPKSAGK